MARYSRWQDPTQQAYWNRVLKDEGLAVVKTRQVIDKRKARAAQAENAQRRSERDWRRRVAASQ